MPGKSPKLRGVVVALKANYVIVELDFKQEISSVINRPLDSLSNRFLCTIRKRMIHKGCFISVGDYVFIEAIDWNSARAVVSDVEPRKTWIDRPPVANVTEIFVMLSAKDPTFDFDQASRFLLTAEKTGLEVSLVISKSDIIIPNKLNTHIERLKGWGYQPFPISVVDGQGINALLKKLKTAKLSVLCGPSGVGKSSLLSYLLPDESIAIGLLSGRLKRGRHTTRHVELYSLGQGSLVADTPGFNRPDLKVDPINLAFLFPELRTQLLSQSCRFRDCLHRDEPGCALDRDWERYSYYREFLDEMISSRH